MSRILHAGRGPAAREALTAAVRRAIAGLVEGLCRQLDVQPLTVAGAAVAGNPTMLHLWRGIDPASLGHAPYLGQWVDAVRCTAVQVGLPTSVGGEVYILPAVRSHVGADAVAAAVAADLDRAVDTTLLVDLGTNSEILLASGGRILAASTAAGPAFEGGAVSGGMRAGRGAIDALHIEPDGRVSVRVIGGGPAAGICGSGLLDAVAELLRVGIVEASGRLLGRGDLGPEVPLALRERLHADAIGKFVALTGNANAGDGVLLRAADIRQVQLATGAVRAGIEVLAAHAGVEPSRIRQVYVAGAFGQFVRIQSVFRLGMLPDVGPERVRLIGNAAGAGARLAAIDARARDRAERMAREIEYVELGGRMDYAEVFAAHLRFPEQVRW